ncbi:GNAT acetyltransferase [Globisporangium polare]
MEIEVARDPAARMAADATLAAQLDALGERSAVAQQLGRAITSSALFASVQQQQQTLYIAHSPSTGGAIGFLKTGVKHLFYVNPKGEYSESDPLCVLDFYVTEEYQRSGIGLQLFQRLLETERVEPRQLAYDRPSPKLFAFLRKHCGLTDFFPQPNNFVIFDDYFSS